MKIGIISDTHDNLPRLGKALEIFADKGVESIIHAGDLISPFVWLDLKKAGIPMTAVFGNNEGEWLMLVEWAKGAGEIKKGPIQLEIGGRKIALMHEPVFIDPLADSGHFDLIVYGHTHVLEKRERNNALIVNPGEACGYLSKKPTAMVCELENMEVEIVELD